MPLYDYFCAHCNKVHEINHKASEVPPTLCPVCQQQGLVRQLSKNFGIQFKGTGFYATDYQNKPSCCDGCPSSCKGH